MNGESASTAHGGTADGIQTPSKMSNGIGGFFKRFSPKYRSRSKSPAAHTHQKIEKSWVTVEIKDYPNSPSAAAGARSTDAYSPPTTSASSPSSPVLRNGGSSTADKSPRVRGAFGNLFHRSSMKKLRDASGHKATKMESRARSEHELASGDVDMTGRGMTSTHSTELTDTRWKSTTGAGTMPLGNTLRLARQNGGDIRDGLTGTPVNNVLASVSSGATRGTLSEEDLVSKSLSRERGDIYKQTFQRGVPSSTLVHSAVPATLTAPNVYHSQDSVFDSPARVPSYVRISCTLSGYRNYRNVDLKTATSPRPVLNVTASNGTSGTDVDADQTDGHDQGAQAQPAVTPLPPGKSIVERRLEKFESQPSQPTKPTSTAVVSSPSKEQRPILEEDGSTPTPVKDLIKNFNKMTIHDGNTPNSRPRQPPPVPPKRERLADRMEFDGEVENACQIESNEVAVVKEANILEEDENGVEEPETDNQPAVYNGDAPELNGVVESVEAQATTDGAFDRVPPEESVSGVVAQRAVEAATVDAMKCVADYFADAHQQQQQQLETQMADEVGQSVQTTAPVQENVFQAEAVVEDSDVTGETVDADEGTVGEQLAADEREAPVEESTVEIMVNADDAAELSGELMKAGTTVETNAASTEDTTMTNDGTYYQTEASRERTRLEKLCAQAELDLNSGVNEEAAEHLRMAIGRVRLLLGKKFAKFEELIEKNLNPNPDDPRPTLVSDLEGYHDLVKMEIEDIDACFETVRQLKENNWQAPVAEVTDGATEPKPTKRAPGSSRIPQAQHEKRSDKQASNARSEAAKQRLKEAKAAAMQRKKQVEADSDAAFVSIEPEGSD